MKQGGKIPSISPLIIPSRTWSGRLGLKLKER